MSPPEHRWLPILMYHRVTAAPVPEDVYGNCVTTRVFARQLSWLRRRGYQTVDLDLVARYARGDPEAAAALPPKPFAITFDDGYRDNLELALPCLQRFGFSATLFVVTGAIGALNDFDPAGREGPLPMLTAEEIRVLRRAGVSIGAHTHTHPATLTTLDDESLRRELVRPRELLEDLLQEPVVHFSYPHSQTDARVEAAVAASGYASACAGRGTAFRPLCLHRVPANAAGGARLEAYCRWRGLKTRFRAVQRGPQPVGVAG